MSSPEREVRVVVVFHDRGRMMRPLAEAIGRGARRINGARVDVRTIDETGPEVLAGADAIVLGSPNWNGPTGEFKRWLDGTGDFWEENPLVGKVGAAFTSAWSRNAGVEFTLWSLLHFLLAHGVIIVGLPWTDRMRLSGSYYGAAACGEVTPDDLAQAEALGERVAAVARALKLGREA